MEELSLSGDKTTEGSISTVSGSLGLPSRSPPSQQESFESLVLGVVSGLSVSSERRSLFPPDLSAMVVFSGVIMLRRS